MKITRSAASRAGAPLVADHQHGHAGGLEFAITASTEPTNSDRVAEVGSSNGITAGSSASARRSGDALLLPRDIRRIGLRLHGEADPIERRHAERIRLGAPTCRPASRQRQALDVSSAVMCG